MKKIGGDFMVHLAGALYVTAIVVHSVQTLTWQTSDICLDTLFWEEKQGYVLGPHKQYWMPLPAGNGNPTDQELNILNRFSRTVFVSIPILTTALLGKGWKGGIIFQVGETAGILPGSDLHRLSFSPQTANQSTLLCKEGYDEGRTLQVCVVALDSESVVQNSTGDGPNNQYQISPRFISEYYSSLKKDF